MDDLGVLLFLETPILILKIYSNNTTSRTGQFVFDIFWRDLGDVLIWNSDVGVII